MAQYGKNYYGFSYYGMTGIFGGQFISDETALELPVGAAGTIHVKLGLALPIAEYLFTDPIFQNEGVWITSGADHYTSTSTFKLIGTLTAKDLELHWVGAPGRATVDVNVKTYIDGSAVEDMTIQINTSLVNGASSTNLTSAYYGEKIVTISMYSGSSGAFYFTKLRGSVTDVSIEMRTKASNDVWSDWAKITLALSNDVWEGDRTGIAGHKAYQFRLLMATSDDSETPVVSYTDISIGSFDKYSSRGFWKMTVDLGEEAVEINTLTFTETTSTATWGTGNAKSLIKTRTSDIDGNWEPWTTRYSTDTTLTLPSKGSTVTSGYVMTPVFDPEYLDNWAAISAFIDINLYDLYEKINTPGANILLEVVTENYNPLVPNSRDVIKTFLISEGTDLWDTLTSFDISMIETPIRLKFNFNRLLSVASPAISSLSLLAKGFYNETNVFGTGASDIKAYGSAVYGDGSGIDIVYMDGLDRATDATIPALAFTVPAVVVQPTYSIELDADFSDTYSDEINIYWSSNSGRDTVLTTDYLMVKVAPLSAPINVHKHYKYGSGILLALSPQYIQSAVTNTFTPPLSATKSYVFHLKNGFDAATKNDHIDIRWKSENEVIAANRRNITYTINDVVYLGISEATEGNYVEWRSDDKIFEGIVNRNDVHGSYYAAIRDLPPIDMGVGLYDPAYVVEVIPGTIISKGLFTPDREITGEVDYIYTTNSDYSFSIETEYKIPVKRGSGNTDLLPRTRTTQLLGVYSTSGEYAPYYHSGVDYDYSSGNIIDWSKGIIGTNGAQAPTEGDTYYVTYKYEDVLTLGITFSCDYKENEYDPQVYRSGMKKYQGQCSPMADFISGVVPTNIFTIDPLVDPSTLKLIVFDDNSRVRTYIKDGKVIGTLDKRDPRESWTPTVKGGYYYINKQPYYMYTNRNSYSFGKADIPIGKNVQYEEGRNGTGIAIQKGTTNLLTNPQFLMESNTTITENVNTLLFSDIFVRGV